MKKWMKIGLTFMVIFWLVIVFSSIYQYFFLIPKDEYSHIFTILQPIITLILFVGIFLFVYFVDKNKWIAKLKKKEGFFIPTKQKLQISLIIFLITLVIPLGYSGPTLGNISVWVLDLQFLLFLSYLLFSTLSVQVGDSWVRVLFILGLITIIIQLSVSYFLGCLITKIYNKKRKEAEMNKNEN